MPAEREKFHIPKIKGTDQFDLDGGVQARFYFEDPLNPTRRKIGKVKEILFYNGKQRTWKQFYNELERRYEAKLKQVLKERQEKKEKADPQYAHHLLDLWVQTSKVSVKEVTFNQYKNTARLYKRYVKDHYIAKTNDVVVSPFKEGLQTHISERTKKNLAKITQYDYFKHFSEIFLTWCLTNKYIESSIKLKGFKKPDHKRHSLTLEELQKVWIYIKEVAENGMLIKQTTYGKTVHYVRKTEMPIFQAMQTYMIVMVYTGMRCSEVWSLKWEDIDLEHGFISTGIETKAQRDDAVALRTVLWDWLIDKNRGRGEDIYLVGNGEGGPFYKNADYISQQFGRVFKRLGINKKPTHGFRFTLATTMKGNKIDIQMQQKVMRHRDVKTLEGYQDPFYVEETRRELDKLPDVLA